MSKQIWKVKPGKRALTLMVTLIMLSTLFTACGSTNDKASSTVDQTVNAGTTKEVASTGEQPAGSNEKELNVLCFQGYAEDTWVKPFEEKYNVKVNVTYAGTIDEMYTKSKTGGAQYDVVSIDCGSVKRYYDADLLKPIDLSKIPNTENMSKFFKEADYKTIDGKVYHSPIVWGSNNIVYNKDKLGELPATWGVLWDPKYKDQVSVTDEANNNIIMTAMYLGFEDPYNLTDKQFEQVKQKLIELKKNCRTLTNGFDSEKNAIGTGETNASVSGYDSGLIMYLRDEAKIKPGRITPKEGIYVWIDGWVMLKNAKNPETAQKWMDTMLSDEVQIALAKAMSFGAVTSAAKEAVDKDVAALCNYDNIDDVKVPIFIMKNPEDPEKRVALWNEAKAAQ
jgi:Spermidine/putrescine-binding periplasmic protein